MNINIISKALAFSLAFGSTAVAQELPGTMIWSSYDVGSAGYSEAAAIADAMGKQYGTRVRIQPGSTAIGRLQPLLQGKADFAFLATEAFFFSEGIFDFATPDGGPKPLRAIAGRSATFVIATAADAEVHSVADLAGKRFGLPIGNPSITEKCAALLGFGGLSYDDMEIIEFPTYKATMASMIDGKADAVCTVPTSGALYELEESPRGLRLLNLDPANTEGWERLEEVLPIMAPSTETVAAGLKDGEVLNSAGYRYPQIAVRADTSTDKVYAFIKALDETFPLYKDAKATMGRWALDHAGVPPIDVPFHEGAIKYLKEKGIWSDESQAWNDTRVAREATLIAAWETFVAANVGLEGEEFRSAWHAARDDALSE